MAYEWIIDALDETWTSIDRTLRPRSTDAYDAATPCPGWSVRDVLSHLIGFELMMSGEPVPDHVGAWPEYVKNPIGEINEAFVVAFRSTPGAEMLDLFRATTRRSLERLRELSDEAWEKVGWSPEGERPYHRFQETRVLDSWIHLQDIRDALLEPADDHGPGEEIVVNRFEAALPYVLAKRARAQDGTLMQLNLSGRLARTVLIGVEGGRARALESTNAVPDLEITTPVALFWRRAAGRVTADAFLRASATDVRGDKALARAFADGLVVMI
ncbi:MAG TPA: maleylpyruvate isomerase N-terminal domain-containing protein [Acidimicrobiales bacterium]|nr:maleylpyruvate isomerase N-terminal domain-containing protein [Acidimicrobiales bacterium]